MSVGLDYFIVCDRFENIVNKMKIRWNRVLRRIFGQKRDEVTGGWKKLHNEELNNLYCSPNIIRMIKSMRMRSAGQVARMERRGRYIEFWSERQKERDHWEDLDVGGSIILK
jgi:PAS domain-containing protein